MHSLDRPYQLPTYEKIKQTKKKVIIVHAETGFGKSGLPARFAWDGHKTLTLVNFKSLQRQYAESYPHLQTLFGKGNYPCLNSVALLGDQPTADDCEPGKKLRKWCNDNCPYPLAKQEFLASVGGVLNYPKFLLDKQLVTEFEPEYLFCDEAHLLSRTVLDYVGLEFFWSSKQLQKYISGTFPEGLPQHMAFPMAVDWLKSLQESLELHKPLEPKHGGQMYPYRWHKNCTSKVNTTLHHMLQEPSCWYVESDNNHLLIKPKTARFDFMPLFDRAQKIILMSATISQYTLRELGIIDYEWIEIPHSRPGWLRLIHDLKAPKMGWRSSDSDRWAWTEAQAKALNSRPPEHTGLIHVSSYDMANDLAYRLGKHTKRRLLVPDRGIGTEELYEQWMNIHDDGTIIITPNAWEGWDCGKDSINIIAKVPFTPIRFESDGNGSKVPVGYDTHRYVYDTDVAQSETAEKLMQGEGRIRRGKDEHYGDNKFVAVADGNWRRVAKFLSSDFKGRMV